MEELYLDPDSVGNLDGDKNYLSVDDLREDLLDLPIYYDWVSGRTPRNIFNPEVRKVSLAWIDIIVISAVRVYAGMRIAGYMNRAFGTGTASFQP